MKLSKLIAVVSVAIMAVSTVACGGKKDQETTTDENIVTLAEAEQVFASSLSSNDTTELMAISSAFMDSLKNGSIDAAVAMLYEPDPNGGVRPVNEKTAEQLRARYTTYPVKSWRMDHMDLSIPSINDLKFIYQLSDEPGMPGMAIMFNPTKVDGKWYLMLKQENQPAKDAANALPENTSVQMPADQQ